MPSDGPWYGYLPGLPGPSVVFDTVPNTETDGTITITGNGRPFTFLQMPVQIDHLEISLANVLGNLMCPSPPCTNPMGVDNIVVSY